MPAPQLVDETSSAYRLPARLENPDGDIRRVGIEVEYAGLDVQSSAEIIAGLYGGRIVANEHLSVQVEDTNFGTFAVEIDSTPLRKRKYLDILRRVGVEVEASKFASWLTESVEGVAMGVVPCEVVTPPVPMTRLAELDPLWHALTRHHAEGTQESIWYAFGLHLNPEVPSFDVRTLHDYIRAFVLLVDWLVEASSVDLSRKVLPYIDSYAPAFHQYVVNPSYRPDLDALVGDYLRFNPSRNRQLDLLPLFAHLRPEQVNGAAEDLELIKSRPTFHYRLPNCNLGVQGWTPALDWNRWVVVEWLAMQPELLDAWSREYLEVMHEHALRGPHLWRERIEPRLEDALAWGRERGREGGRWMEPRET